jgi:sugar phosphate isomerase/epimerase
MAAKPIFQVGVTFHSFAREYLSFVYSFEDMMEKASLLGGGVEIVGPSHHRGFPEVTDEFERSFKSSLERYGLTPTCYGSYADPFMLPGRDLTPDELYEYTVPQIKGAAKLGFPVVRLQHFASVIAERLIPLAEKLDLKMGYELHTPLMIESARTQELLAQIRQIGSERLGVIPDCGIFGRSISQHHLNLGKESGVTEEQIQKALKLWAAKTPMEETVEIFRSMGAAEQTITWIGMVWDSLGFSDPADMAGIMPYIFHMHGKFFNIVNGEEPDLRYEEVVKVLLENGYAGWMSSEFEGGETDSFAIVQAHQKMIKGYINKYLKGQVPGMQG